MNAAQTMAAQAIQVGNAVNKPLALLLLANLLVLSPYWNM